jgi:dipeptidyl aminopeptidase/acylaminoacyl peptidase
MKAALAGVGALVAKLGEQGLIDPARVGMGGFSHGSEVTTWIAMHSSLLAAVSISSTQEEPSSYWLDVIGAPDRAKTKRSVWHLGAPDETPSQWKLQSPALNTDHLHAPILFQMPEQEARRIPELIARLYRSATPTELYAFPDEDHLFLQPRHQAAIYSRNLDWFRYWLQSAKDPDPLKQAQYERWDALRQKACANRTQSAKVSCSAR